MRIIDYTGGTGFGAWLEENGAARGQLVYTEKAGVNSIVVDSTDDLRGIAIETSFGFAFGLVLDQELVLLHLQPSLEVLVAYADRLEAALLAQGWQRLATCPLHTKERS